MLQNNKLSIIEKALMFASYHNYCQLDKIGKPYILHSLSVGLSGKSELEQVVGFLHDIVENCDVLIHEIKDEFGVEIAKAIDAITKREEESYSEYIERCSLNDLARAVKINDLKHNLNPERMTHLDFKERKGLEKRYNRALNRLDL
jgi:(p)ppGpp synthase/HD superfamily hydrolase